LQPEKPCERASRIAQEAKTILEIVGGFEPAFEELWRNPVRRSVIEEIEKASQKVLGEAEQENEDIRRYPILDRDSEVWIYAAQTQDRTTYFLSPAKLKRESAQFVAAQLRLKGAIYLPFATFNDVVGKLKTFILEGKIDDRLHLTVEHLIYDEMAKARSL